MLKNIASYSGWQAVGQVLSSASLMLLSLFLSAQALATYGLAITTGSLLASLMTLRIEQAILVAGDDDEASQLAWAAVAFAISVAIVLALLSSIGLSALGIAISTLTVVTGIILALSNGLLGVAQQLLIRGGKSSKAGQIGAIRSALVALAVVCAAYFGDHSDATAALVASLVGSVALSVYYILQMTSASTKWPGLQLVRAGANRYADVWGPYFGQTLISALALNMPYYFFFFTVSPSLCSGFLLAERVVRLPINLISSSIRSHFVHDIRLRLRSSGLSACIDIINRWSGSLLVIGILFSLLAGISTHFATKFFLVNDAWVSAGVCMMLLSLWSGAILSSSPSAAFLTVQRQNAFMMKAQAAEMVIKAALLAPVVFTGDKYFYLILFLAHLPNLGLRIITYRKAIALANA